MALLTEHTHTHMCVCVCVCVCVFVCASGETSADTHRKDRRQRAAFIRTICGTKEPPWTQRSRLSGQKEKFCDDLEGSAACTGNYI